MVAIRRCLAVVLLLAVSCAKPSESNQAIARDPNVISKAEMQDPMISGWDALKAIRYLRPAFFRPMGPQSFSDATAGQVQYSFDYGPLRPAGELITHRLDFLYEVRYLNANEAQNRFGLNANGGPVIVLLNNKQ